MDWYRTGLTGAMWRSINWQPFDQSFKSLVIMPALLLVLLRLLNIVLMAEEHSNRHPTLFAQEPRYNAMDEDLLRTLNIRTVKHPTGFCLLNTRSFAFCPGAEQSVVLRTLPYDPAIYLGGKLESYKGSDGYLRSSVISRLYYLDGDEGKTLSLDEIEERGGSNDAQTWLQERRKEEADDVDVIHHYMKDKEMAKLPDLDAQDFPFYGMHLHWRPVDRH